MQSVQETDTEEFLSEMSLLLNQQINRIWTATYPPEAKKTLRSFTAKEAASLIGVTSTRLRQLELDGEIPPVARLGNSARRYTLSDIDDIRQYYATKKASDALKFLPRRQGEEKLQVITVANFKGGCAKTTTSIHLAQYLALKGLRVLAVDLDPQASLTETFGIRAAIDVGSMESIYGVVCYDEERPEMKDVIRKSYFHGLDFIPAHAELNYFEHETPGAISNPEFVGKSHFVRRIAAALETVEDDYDVVILDAPPQLSYMTLNAIYAATGLIVPVQPAMIDVASMSQFLSMLVEMLSAFKDAGTPFAHDFFRLLITRHNPNDVPQTTLAAMMRSLFLDKIIGTTVLDTTAIANAGLENKSLYELNRSDVSRDTYIRAIDSVNAVNGEIFDLIEKAWGRK